MAWSQSMPDLSSRWPWPLRLLSRVVTVSLLLFPLLFLAVSFAVAQRDLEEPQQNYSTRDSAIKVALAWAGMNPLPPGAHVLQAHGDVELFTRHYVVEFQASPAAVRSWLADSPATHGVAAKQRGDWESYELEPVLGDAASLAIRDGRLVTLSVRAG